MSMQWAALIRILESSARSGRKAHLTPEMCRAIIQSDAYAMLMETRRNELIEAPPMHR